MNISIENRNFESGCYFDVLGCCLVIKSSNCLVFCSLKNSPLHCIYQFLKIIFKQHCMTTLIIGNKKPNNM